MKLERLAPVNVINVISNSILLVILTQGFANAIEKGGGGGGGNLNTAIAKHHHIYSPVNTEQHGGQTDSLWDNNYGWQGLVQNGSL